MPMFMKFEDVLAIVNKDREVPLTHNDLLNQDTTRFFIEMNGELAATRMDPAGNEILTLD
jgi:hypothetical protein